MKIFHVSDYFNPSTGHFINIATQKLSKKGNEVKVFTSTALFDAKKYPESRKDFEVKRLKGKIIFGKNIYPSLVKEMLFGEKPDIVHSYVFGFWSSFVCAYCKLVRKYVLVIEADFDPMHKKEVFPKSIYTYFYKIIPAKIADKVTVFTEEQKEELSKRYGIKKEKIEVLPIGIDYENFRLKSNRNIRKELGIENKFVLINVSKVWRVKRLEWIINAINKIPDSFFIHIGSVKESDYQKELDGLIKKLNLKDKILFLGEKHIEELRHYYQAADVYVQTSKTESYCIPILEAMASGLPIITTPIGIAKQEIKDGKNGFIIGNENELNKKILFLRGKEIRKKIRKRNLIEAGKYNWKEIIKKLESIYEKLSEKKGINKIFSVDVEKDLGAAFDFAKLLEKNGLRGEFFFCGFLAERNPKKIKKIAEKHLVGGHGFFHEDFARLNEKEQEELIEKTIKAFNKAGVKMKGWRFPFLSFNSDSMKILNEKKIRDFSVKSNAMKLWGNVLFLRNWLRNLKRGIITLPKPFVIAEEEPWDYIDLADDKFCARNGRIILHCYNIRKNFSEIEEFAVKK